MDNKRGQSLSINTIIIIILAVLVLIIVIAGFIIGWDKIGNYIKPSNNVKEITDACNVACATGSKYDFCSVERKLKIEKDIAEFSVAVGSATMTVPALKSGDSKTCYYYTFYPSLGIGKCDALACDKLNFEPGYVVPAPPTA